MVLLFFVFFLFCHSTAGYPLENDITRVAADELPPYQLNAEHMTVSEGESRFLDPTSNFNPVNPNAPFVRSLKGPIPDAARYFISPVGPGGLKYGGAHEVPNGIAVGNTEVDIFPV